MVLGIGSVVPKGPLAATSCDDPESVTVAKNEPDAGIKPLASLPKGTRQRRRKQVDALSDAIGAEHLAGARVLAKRFSLRDIVHMEEASGLGIGVTETNRHRSGRRICLSKRRQRLAWYLWGDEVNRYELDKNHHARIFYELEQGENEGEKSDEHRGKERTAEA